MIVKLAVSFILFLLPLIGAVAQESSFPYELDQLPPECNAYCQKALRDFLSQIEINNVVWQNAIYDFCTKEHFLDSLLRSNGLPSKLKTIPITASFMNTAYSDSFYRVGYWNLSVIDALSWGLRVDFLVDERRHFVKSSLAAIQKLKRLYAKHKNIDTVVLRFFLEGPAHAEEEQQYAVSKWLIWKLTYEKIENQLSKTCPERINKPNNTVVIKTDTIIFFDCISRFCQVSTEELYALNPIYYRGIVVAGDSFLIPASAKNCFDSLLGKITKCSGGYYDREKVAIVYKIKYGDNLSKIARRYGVSVKDIMRWNKLRSTRIYAGQKLVIYVSRNKLPKTKKSSKVTKTRQSNNVTQARSNGTFKTYIVKEGDTLFDIAKKHGIPLEQLMEVNNLSTDVIYPGQKILIPIK